MSDSQKPLTVAIVGAGPSGIFAAAHLLRRIPEVSVDVFDRLPTPYGLLRYGIAPDHLKMKSVAAKFRKTFDDSRVRFIGNVEFGVDITREDLEASYNAVIVAAGCPDTRQLSIPGQDLPGSVTAAEVVSWYNGHPDAESRAIPSGRRVVVVGAGNVALDVSRVLLKGARGLRHTDVPDQVMSDLADRELSNIDIIARRGVAQCKFTVAELLEFDAIDDLDIVVDPDDVRRGRSEVEDCTPAPAMRLVLDAFDRWSTSPPSGASRTLRFHFSTTPVAVHGAGVVQGLDVVTPTGTRRFPADAVVGAVGYRGRPLADLPFDADRCVIPNEAGRVELSGEGAWYVTGWLKRGPSGVIGTNKACSAATVATLCDDLDEGRIDRSPKAGAAAILPAISTRGATPVTWEGWQRIDDAEKAAGTAQGRERVKIAGRDLLMEAAAG